jgi:hypothetical protein
MTDKHLARLKEFGVSFDELQSLFENLEDPYTVFVGGSIVEGYGNAESDIDAYVIYAREIPAQEITEFKFEGRTVGFDYVSDRRVDLESWSLSYINTIAEKIRSCSADLWKSAFIPTENEITFAHRILNGIPLVNTENFLELQARFESSQVSKLLAARYLAAYNDVAEDASGAITSRQYGPMLLLSRDAVRLALDAYIASMGETNAKAKWRFQKLEKIGDPDLSQQYWNIELGTDLHSHDDIPTCAEEWLRFATKLTYQATRKIQ